MVIRLNRVSRDKRALTATGIFQCRIPSAERVNITRSITLSGRGKSLRNNIYINLLYCLLNNAASFCSNLPEINNGSVTYTPPNDLANFLYKYTGTIATYSCSPGYQLVEKVPLRACNPNGTWNGTAIFCTCGE